MREEKAPDKGQDCGIYTTTIRVSNQLINRIRNRADGSGASVNSTICHLLDLGLMVQQGNITILLEGESGRTAARNCGHNTRMPSPFEH